MIYVTGDMHGASEYGRNRLSFHSWPLGRELTRDDVVIVAGDFGYVWGGGNTDAYWLKWLEGRPWTTCFVDGNHENHGLLAAMPEREWCGGRVHEVRPHVLHLMRGQVFDIDGRLSYRTWFFGHYHDDGWRDDRHRLIYRDIVPIDVRRTDEDREVMEGGDAAVDHKHLRRC